ncbi:hypothetical protein V8E36_000260 [Tilletia maclaganii]
MKFPIFLSLTFALLLSSAHVSGHGHHHTGHHHHKTHSPKDHGSRQCDGGADHQEAPSVPAPITAGGGVAKSTPEGLHGTEHVKAPPQPGQGQHCEVPGGMATQYWDCCKVSASWPDRAAVSRPVASCARDGLSRLDDTQVLSSCQGGNAYACTNHAAFTSPTNPNIAYAVGARWSGHDIKKFYGACYAIHFDQLPGKTLIFQAVNAGWGYDPRQIDIQTPGGGEGQSPGCIRQWAGQFLGGVGTKADCPKLPIHFRDQCHWRFDWLSRPNEPHGTQLTIGSMCRVRCPAILTDRTGSVRDDDASYPPAPQ